MSGLQTFLYQNYRNVVLLQESKKQNIKNDLSTVYNRNGEYDNNNELYNVYHNNNQNDPDTKIGKLNYNNMLMQLRKLCNHPYLVLEDVRTIPDSLYYDYLVRASGKLSVLDGILKTLLPKGHKVSSCFSFDLFCFVLFHFILISYDMI